MKTESGSRKDSRPDDAFLDRLASNIETFRHRSGLSLAALAARADVSLSEMKHIVHRRANPSVVEVLRLANVLGVTVRDLTESSGDDSLPAPLPRQYDTEGLSATLGARLRAYRTRKGVSTGELTKLAPIAGNTLRAIERGAGEPGVRFVARIAHALDVSFADLIESLHSPILAYAPMRRSANEVDARELLSDSRAAEPLRMEELRLRRHQTIIRSPLSAGSTAMIYAVDGILRIAFEGEDLVLQQREAALVAADRQFAITALGGKLASLLLIVRTAERTSVDGEI